MSRFIFESVKILQVNPNYTLQWRRVFFYGLKSHLCKNHQASVSNGIHSAQLKHYVNTMANMRKSINLSKFDVVRAFGSNTILYSIDEKETRQKFYDKTFGDCEIRHRKDKRGEVYKVVVCKTDNKNKPHGNPTGGIPPGTSVLRVLGAVALTVAGIILAAYSAVFFVSVAANIIVIIAIIGFFIICYRVLKENWLQKWYRRRR